MPGTMEARRLRDWLPAVFAALAIVLGGGGSPAPLPELLLEWVAIAVLLALVWTVPPSAWPRAALVLAGILLVVPALQLVPLPPAIWQRLPGRETEVAALALVDAQQRWMPLSVGPARTLASLLSLLVPVAALLATAVAGPAGRRRMLLTIVALGLVSVALGAGQLAGGRDSALVFYPHSHREVLVGFQANRNAEADVLLIALLALGGLVLATERATLRRGWAAIAAACALALATGVVLTASRGGAALLAVLIAGGVLGLGWRGLRRYSAPARWSALASGAALLAFGAAISLRTAAFAPLARRFAEGQGSRPQLWQDTWYAIGQYWPVGSGVGTFAPVFIAAEPLESVDFGVPNRAHNDFLELALEAGLPGLLVLAAAILLIGRLWHRRWQAADDRAERGELLFSALVLGLCAAHSAIDYPLRSMALAALAGGATGLIAGKGSRRSQGRDGEYRQS